eukprot:Sdes_comp17608_c0_seq1m6869
MKLPDAPACGRNREPILSIIKPLFEQNQVFKILEIGSGTGQHAVYFAANIKNIVWQTGDMVCNHEAISGWIEFSEQENSIGANSISGSKVLKPIDTTASQSSWKVGKYDAIFSSNTFHIMSWNCVLEIFNHVCVHLKPNGIFLYYGPLNYNGKYTSESNRRFDDVLKARDPQSGIRDIYDLNCLAKKVGLSLEQDFEMPSNNRLILWRYLKKENISDSCI